MTHFRGGEPELLADEDRPGGWLLLLDRIRQSYVDLDDPTYLDFEYVQAFAGVVDAMRDGSLAVTHVGGGACTLARYIAVTRPGSPQIVLEPDEALTAMVRARLPFPRNSRIRVRPVEGREGTAGLKTGSADVLVLDAFQGGRVPTNLTTAEYAADVARVLTDDGVMIANIADGPPLTYIRRVVASIRLALPQVLIRADPAVLKGRRFGNIVIAASRAELPVVEIASDAASAMFRQQVIFGAGVTRFVGGATPLTDADPMRSPTPPEDMWRVAD